MYPKPLNLMLLHPLSPEGTQKGGKRKKEDKKKKTKTFKVFYSTNRYLILRACSLGLFPTFGVTECLRTGSM